MSKSTSFAGTLIRAIAVAMSLGGMLISSSVTLAALLNQAPPGILLGGLVFTALFIAMYAWAENVRERPLFWLVPGIWLLISLIGIGVKGEGLILGLPVLLLVSGLVRRHYNGVPLRS